MKKFKTYGFRIKDDKRGIDISISLVSFKIGKKDIEMMKHLRRRIKDEDY